jgi:hypothetical protein
VFTSVQSAHYTVFSLSFTEIYSIQSENRYESNLNCCFNHFILWADRRSIYSRFEHDSSAQSNGACRMAISWPSNTYLACLTANFDTQFTGDTPVDTLMSLYRRNHGRCSGTFVRTSTLTKWVSCQVLFSGFDMMVGRALLHLLV